jgi:hypothetical protein
MENDTTTTAQVTDPAEELRLIRQALLLLEERLDEQESRINALSGLLQVQTRDGQTVCEGLARLSKIIEGHHTLLQSLALALPQRRQPSTLQ